MCLPFKANQQSYYASKSFFTWRHVGRLEYPCQQNFERPAAACRYIRLWPRLRGPVELGGDLPGSQACAVSTGFPAYRSHSAKKVLLRFHCINMARSWYWDSFSIKQNKIESKIIVFLSISNFYIYLIPYFYQQGLSTIWLEFPILSW